MKKGGRKYKSCHAEKGIFPPLSLTLYSTCPCFLVVPELRNAYFQMTLTRWTRRSFLCRMVPATATSPAAPALMRDEDEDGNEHET